MLAGKTVLTASGASALDCALGPMNLAWYQPKAPCLDSRNEVEPSGLIGTSLSLQLVRRADNRER